MLIRLKFLEYKTLSRIDKGPDIRHRVTKPGNNSFLHQKELGKSCNIRMKNGGTHTQRMLIRMECKICVILKHLLDIHVIF